MRAQSEMSNAEGTGKTARKGAAAAQAAATSATALDSESVRTPVVRTHDASVAAADESAAPKRRRVSASTGSSPNPERGGERKRAKASAGKSAG